MSGSYCQKIFLCTVNLKYYRRLYIFIIIK
jgi:hypothetical protein